MFYTLQHFVHRSYGYETVTEKLKHTIKVNNDFDAYEQAITILRRIRNGHAKLLDWNGDLVMEFEYDNIFSNDWEVVYE